MSEGRDARVLDALRTACGPSLLDLHADPDHHRSVFTLAGPGALRRRAGVRRLARAVAEHVDLTGARGRAPAPRRARRGAVRRARRHRCRRSGRRGAGVRRLGRRRRSSSRCSSTTTPIRAHRTLPELRRDAFTSRAPDLGPSAPHPTLGAVAVGARPVLVAVNCWLDRDDVALGTRHRARRARARRRAAGRARARTRARVGEPVAGVDEPGRPRATGLQDACDTVCTLAARRGADVARVELVGLVPAAGARPLRRRVPRVVGRRPRSDDRSAPRLVKVAKWNADVTNRYQSERCGGERARERVARQERASDGRVSRPQSSDE